MHDTIGAARLNTNQRNLRYLQDSRPSTTERTRLIRPAAEIMVEEATRGVVVTPGETPATPAEETPDTPVEETLGTLAGETPDTPPGETLDTRAVEIPAIQAEATPAIQVEVTPVTRTEETLDTRQEVTAEDTRHPVAIEVTIRTGGGECFTNTLHMATGSGTVFCDSTVLPLLQVRRR